MNSRADLAVQELSPAAVSSEPASVAELPGVRCARFEALCSQLETGTAEERAIAARHLRRFGPSAVPALLAALRSGAEPVRVASAASLGWIRDSRAAPALLEALVNGEDGGRRPIRVALSWGSLAVFVWALIFATGAASYGAASTVRHCLAVSLLGLIGFGVSRLRLGKLRRASLAALTGVAERYAHPKTADRLDFMLTSIAHVFGFDTVLFDAARRAVTEMEAAAGPIEAGGVSTSRGGGELLQQPGREEWRSLLKDPKPQRRVCGVLRAADSGEAVLEALCAALKDPDARVKAVAVWTLGRRADSQPLEPLLEALKDPDRDVRVAAAEALGQLEDERAIGPLQEALRRGFAGNSARLQKVKGQLLLLLACAMLGTIFFHQSMTHFAGVLMILCPLQFILPYLWRRRKDGRLVEAAADSLAWIVDVRPRPSLRSILADLSVLAGDRIQQDKRTRRTCREAAARIREGTDRIEALPVPVEREPEPSLVLPVPAEGAAPAAVELPRVPEVYR